MRQVVGLSHLTVHVTDLDASEKFYEEIMGLEPMGRDLVCEDGPTSTLRTDSGHLVVLVEVADVEPFRGNTTSIHHAWYLTPEQHAKAIERMKAKGEDIADTREAFRAMGQKSFDVFDPDGHRYQVQTVGPEAYDILKPNRGVVACGHISQYEPGDVRLFNDAKLYVVRGEDGFLALSRWCTHMNGLLQWRPNHWYFFCPYHMATFNRCGESTSHAPYDTLPPLRIHPLSVDGDGIVKVDTDVILVRKKHSAADATPAEPGAATVCKRFEAL